MYPIIDAHAHVYPDKIAAKAAGSTSDFYQVAAQFDGTLSELFAQERAAGVSHCIVSSVATTPKQVSAINTYLSQTAAAHPDFLTALGTLHPLSDDPVRDVEQLLALGLKGVKLHPDIQGFRLDEPCMLRIFELCQDRLPLLLHLGDNRYDFSNPARVKSILRQFPRLRIIGAHFAGWSIWEQATQELAGCETLTVDCASSMYALPPETVLRLIRTWGAGRVLFGTDYPLMAPQQEVARFMQLPLTEDERESILWKNAAAFYNL